MIKRVRPKYTDIQLKEIYARPHDSRFWHDHSIRVSQTSELAKWIASNEDVNTVGDLSCGNALIAKSIPCVKIYLGDFAPGYRYEGPIEKTIKDIPHVDLFILSETLEHLDNPQFVLDRIREKTKYIVLSTPDNAGDDPNPEHYWSWNMNDVKVMLYKAGFEVFVSNQLRLKDYLYDFMILGAR